MMEEMMITLVGKRLIRVNTQYGEKEKVLIKTKEFGDNELGSFHVSATNAWYEGNQYKIIFDTVQKGDKTYYNFKVPGHENNVIGEMKKVINTLWQEVKELKLRVEALERVYVKGKEDEPKSGF